MKSSFKSVLFMAYPHPNVNGSTLHWRQFTLPINWPLRWAQIMPGTHS